MPRASASLARGLSSDPSPRVSPGSISFNRNFLPLVTRKGLANLWDFLMTRCTFMIPPPKPLQRLALRPEGEPAAKGNGARSLVGKERRGVVATFPHDRHSWFSPIHSVALGVPPCLAPAPL